MAFPRKKRDRDEPTEDLPQVDDPNKGLIRTPFDDMHVHREKLYLGMGFSEASAAALAAVREGVVPLHPGKVLKTLRAGASHEQAERIFI